jgi:hypothetical protein
MLGLVGLLRVHVETAAVMEAKLILVAAVLVDIQAMVELAPITASVPAATEMAAVAAVLLGLTPEAAVVVA